MITINPHPDEFGRNRKIRDTEGNDPFNRWIESLMDAEAEFGNSQLEE